MIRLLLVSVALFTGCSTLYDKEEDNLAVNQNPNLKVHKVESLPTFNMDKIIDTTEFLLLETNDDCLIGDVSKLIVSDGKVIVFDKSKSNAIYVFDAHNGDFLFQIGVRGRGPGEYYFIVDFDIYKDEVAVVDQGSKDILIYSLQDGTFVRKETFGPTDYNGTNYMVRLDSNYYFYCGNNGFRYNYSLVTVNAQSLVHQKALSFTDEKLSSLSSNVLTRSHSEVFVAQLFNDTIYQVDHTGILPLYVLQSESNRLPQDFFKSVEMGSPDFYKRFFSFWGNPHRLLASDRHIYFAWGHLNKRLVFGLIDRETDEVNMWQTYESKKANVVGSIAFLDRDSIYSIIWINHNEADRNGWSNVLGVEELNENSNPILAIHKLR